MRLDRRPRPAARRRLLPAVALVAAGLALPACYAHHAPSDAPPPPACESPRLLGPETGRAGTACDDCEGPRSRRPGPLVVRGDVAYRHAVDLEVIDVSSPREPILVTHVATVSPRAASLALADGALVVGGAFAEIFDLGDPLAPRAAAILPGASVGFAVAAEGSLVVVASPAPDGAVLRTVDVRSPHAPVVRGETAIGAATEISALALAGETAWLVAPADAPHAGTPPVLIAVDVRDPAAPALVSRTPLWPGALDAGSASFSAERGLLVLCGTSGVRALEPGAPPRPVAIPDGVPCGPLVARRTLATRLRRGRHGESALALVDLARPEAPLERSRAPFEGEVDHAALVGDALLVSNAEALSAFPVACR